MNIESGEIKSARCDLTGIMVNVSIEELSHSQTFQDSVVLCRIIMNYYHYHLVSIDSKSQIILICPDYHRFWCENLDQDLDMEAVAVYFSTHREEVFHLWTPMDVGGR